MATAGALSKLLSKEWIMRDIDDAFDNASSRKDRSFLTKEDYKVAVISLLGHKPTEWDAELLWTSSKEQARRDDCKFRGISRQTFKNHMIAKTQAISEAEMIRNIFVSFDIHSRGFLTLECCVAAFKEVLPRVKESVVEQLFSKVDVDQDNRIRFTDFELMIYHYSSRNAHCI